MLNDMESPKAIYRNVSVEVDRILKKLEGSPENEKISAATESARKILKDLQEKINIDIAALKGHAEWDTFTIAFYGETNAGKSTLIETLRIMLKEQHKIKAQHRFKSLMNKHGISDERFEALRRSILQNEESLTQLQKDLNDSVQQHEAQEDALKEKIRHLQLLTAEKMKAASLWQKILRLFLKLPEEKARKKAMKNLKTVEAERRNDIKRFTQQQLKEQRRKTALEKEHKRLEEKLKHLEVFADGGIIGNGRSDFTVKTKDYTFEWENQKFILLDVPGIEGKESQVIESIGNAVQKAHAVFYVTGKAAAPQKGSESNKGTLEKIKEHLDAQTEVWTIFNKRITNPLQLEKGELISQDEQDSLQDLDSKMREQLGENYQKVFPLSAQPAFLAVADCLLPDSSNAKSRSKILSKFSTQEVLCKSNVSNFHELLTSKLLKDSKSKIKRSNFNKANQVVKAATTQVTTIQRETFLPLSQQLKQNTEDARIQLDLALKGLKNRLETQGERAISDFNNTVRKKIYERIEKDISNDAFKTALQNFIEEEQVVLQSRLPQAIESELKKFQSEISAVIERFREYVRESMETYSKIQARHLDSKFELKIDIDNGVKWQNLVGTLVGGAFLFWNPAGWVVLALSVVTLLVSLGKALISLFSSSYKMSQQRQAADENLQKIKHQMEIEMRKSLDDAFPALQTKVDEIKNAVEEPARQVAEIIATLVESAEKLTILSNTIEAKGAR